MAGVQRTEMRRAVLLAGHHFAIDNSALPGTGLVEPAAIAVEFDLVQPRVAGRRSDTQRRLSRDTQLSIRPLGSVEKSRAPACRRYAFNWMPANPVLSV